MTSYFDLNDFLKLLVINAVNDLVLQYCKYFIVSYFDHTDFQKLLDTDAFDEDLVQKHCKHSKRNILQAIKQVIAELVGLRKSV